MTNQPYKPPVVPGSVRVVSAEELAAAAPPPRPNWIALDPLKEPLPLVPLQADAQTQTFGEYVEQLRAAVFRALWIPPHPGSNKKG